MPATKLIAGEASTNPSTLAPMTLSGLAEMLADHDRFWDGPVRDDEPSISQCDNMKAGDLAAGAHGERIDGVHHRKQRLLPRWPLRGADPRGR